MEKYKRKMNVVVMDPVQFHRDSLAHVLHKFLADRVEITDMVPSLSEIMRLLILKGPADIYITEAYGKNESYKTWRDFTHVMAKFFPSAIILVWSSKPTIFIRTINAFEVPTPCWQVPKKIAVDCFIRFLTQITDGEQFAPPYSRFCIGPTIPNLTLSEILIIADIIEGCSMQTLSQKYNIAYKTVATHKRNAMIKMCVSSNAQLRSLFMDLSFSRGINVEYFPIDISKKKFSHLACGNRRRLFSIRTRLMPAPARGHDS
ncbi:response regulator transcription factor (plasmid) [Serratia ureilytica]|nr:response regulator transcription factor [Serratia ureilytica]